ncbi:non-LTR retroelement reverse transcriptase-like protein [Striga asiatica]|uniref:Non-LTR retroelement reverse transcriptase-like protein n=1 Tax=Striga asiatica TaxID=4170 RepID=A0A5A7P353_STRAF|nr:non-LTR retroelement reverse transcriptase-like protein [Striga asiatica]
MTLEDMRKEGGDRNWEVWDQLQKELEEAHCSEEIFWQQKARALWLKEEIEETISAYFENLYTSQGSSNGHELLPLIPTTITDELNNILLAPVEEDEIRKAVFSIHPLKAPGEDGMTRLFYQNFWPIISRDICAAVKNNAYLYVFLRIKMPFFLFFHFLNGHRSGTNYFMALELDIVKAFDCVEWKAIQLAMLRMGFHRQINGQVERGNFRVFKFPGKTFQQFTGQQVNMGKSTIFFNKNSPMAIQHRCCSMLPGIQVHSSTRYLGFPLGIGKSKKEAFEYIVTTVKKRIISWRNKWLTTAGKEVLIRVVLNALHVFAMSCSVLAVGLCAEISKICAQFWWTQIDYAAWRFRLSDIQLLNSALIAKQLWKLVSEPDRLVTKKQNSSWLWNCWLSVLKSCGNSMQIVVRNGRSIKILPGRDRDIEYVRDLMSPEDEWSWALHKKGTFSVKSTYSYLITQKFLKAGKPQGSGDLHLDAKVRTRSWKLKSRGIQVETIVGSVERSRDLYNMYFFIAAGQE